MTRATPTHRRRPGALLVALLAGLSAWLTAAPRAATAGPALTLQVKAPWAEGGTIDTRYTCDGADVSPALSWRGGGNGSLFFAITCVDPDAPGGCFVHWLVYDLPFRGGRIDEDAPKTLTLPGGARQGLNDFGRVGWGGPCPPAGARHRYVITVYAYRSPLGLAPKCRITDLEKALRGRVTQTGRVTGVFAH